MTNNRENAPVKIAYKIVYMCYLCQKIFCIQIQVIYIAIHIYIFALSRKPKCHLLAF